MINNPFYEAWYPNGSRFIGGTLAHPMWANAPDGISSLHVILPTGDMFSLRGYEYYSLLVGASTSLVSGGRHRTVYRHVFALARRQGATTCYLIDLSTCTVAVVPTPSWGGLVWKRGSPPG